MKPDPKAKLGSGGRFAALKESVEKEGKSPKVAGAIAASVGRKKYGKAKFQKMAAQGREKY